MSDFENKNSKVYAEESVDDILAGILNSDGTFNEEFNGLLKKYVGGDSPVIIAPASDISDRRDEPVVTAASRVEYEENQDISFAAEAAKSIDERIEEKLPEIARDLFAKASAEAQRPEFTSTGDVKYPAMGIGESEERVVFDADWEETARKEAARLERVRQDRMLRGDSMYARSFAPAGAHSSRKNPYIDAPEQNSAYIDPVSDDDDFENMVEHSQYYSSSRKSFFPEGFSVTQKNNSASGGKTERSRSGSAAYYRKETATRSDASWLQVEEKPTKKKRGIFGKKNGDAKSTEKKADAAAPVIADVTRQEEQPSDDIRKYTEAMAAVIAEEIDVVEKETEGLRSTVAQIVDKYNKRSEEDERKRLEEQVRREEERRREELRERRRLEEIRGLKDQMSPEVFRVIESTEPDEGFDEYEDFSTEPSEKADDTQKKNFSVVFDPSAFDDEKITGREFTERISPEKIESMLSVDDAAGDNDAVVSGKKKTDRKNRRKDS